MEILLEVQKCRSWEEEFYWKHVKSVHFFRTLPHDFHERLVLPRKFAGNMFLELPNKVALFGPGGVKSKWDVTLTKTNNVAIVGDGWKEFVKAYALKVTDLLVFKYTQSKGFEVLIFDPETCCEKEAGYFVKNDKLTINSNNDDDDQNKRGSAEAFGTATEVLGDDDSFDDSEFVTSKRVRKDTEGPLCKGEGNLEIVQSSKPTETSVGMPNKDQTGEEQPVVENTESGLGLGCSHQSTEIRGKKQSGKEGAWEHTSPRSGEGNLEIVQSPKPNETAGKKTNGSELVKELKSSENGGSTLEIARPIRCYETRRKKLKEAEAAKAQHGINREIVHSPISIEVIDLLGDKSNEDDSGKEQDDLDTGAKTWEMVSYKARKTRGRPRRQITPNSLSKLKLQSDSAMGWFAKEYVSNRRAVTEKEKENALRRAEQRLSDKSFIAVMRPTTVYRRFYLHIPSDWAHKFLPRHNHEVVLRVGDKSWPASFYYFSQRGAAGLGSIRWKKFVFDNHLEEFDVCVVKLASQKGDIPTVFDVEIFRVIPETVSPTLTVPF